MELFKTNTVKKAIVGIYTILLFSSIIAFLYLGSIVLIPLSLAILLAFLFSPLVTLSQKWIGRILSVIIVIFLIASSVSFISYLVSREFVGFAGNLPTYKTNIDARVRAIREYQESLARQSSAFTELKNKLLAQTSKKDDEALPSFNFNQTLLNAFEFIFGSFLTTIGYTLLILLFTFFILLYREDLSARVIRLLGLSQIPTSTKLIHDASQRVSIYLRMFLLINFLYGIAVSIGLFLIGIPNAALWGALSGILRFIPYVGVWIASIIPIALSFAISTTWVIPAITIIFFITLETITANLIEPVLYGTTTGISALALLVAAFFWTLLWGPVGLILSTPLTVCLVVIGRNVSRLEFLNILLSDEEPLLPYQDYYYRLLTGNMNDVMHLIDVYLKDKSLISLYDDVFLPVIEAAEKDNRKEILEEDQLAQLYQNMDEIIDALEERDSVKKEDTQIVPKKAKTVILIPAKAKRDELACKMLGQVLRHLGIHTHTFYHHARNEEIMHALVKNKTNNIAISVTYPSTIVQARYLCHKIKMRFPKSAIIVGLWEYKDDLTAIEEGLKNSGADQIATTLQEALEKIVSNKNRQ